jgi:hypothetical protein
VSQDDHPDALDGVPVPHRHHPVRHVTAANTFVEELLIADWVLTNVRSFFAFDDVTAPEVAAADVAIELGDDNNNNRTK